MYDTVIVGGGPAALTAGIYAGKAMLNTLLFEGFMAGGVPAGGQLMTTTEIENFPGFAEPILASKLMTDMREQTINAGVNIKTKTVDKIVQSETFFDIIADGETYQSKTVIIATGATAKKLGIPGQDKYRQKGISACAICDGGLPMFRGQELGVVGGGDAACEEALYLTKFASKVYMFVRRNVLRASKVMQQRVFDNDKIELVRHTEVQEAKGDNKQLSGIVLYNNQEDKKYDMQLKGLFYAIGHKPNTDFLDGMVNMDSNGYIMTYPRVIDEHITGKNELDQDTLQRLRETAPHFATATSVPGIFVAGDVADKKYRQAIVAAGTGCQAALEVEEYLHSL